jgi:hypothetical protein
MKSNPTFDHLANNSFDSASESDPKATSQFITEYGFTARQFSGGFPAIATLIEADAKERNDFRWAPDANVAIRDEADVVWSAMQRSHLLDYEPQCLLLAPVYKELEDWLLEPRRKHQLANDIRDYLDREGGFVRFFWLFR